MVEVSAGLVKELRERTGAGMMDCKKALAESAGSIDSAIEWLRKKGLAAAAKKASRVAAEGLVAALAQNGSGVLVEVNSETDFVARNERFQTFVRTVAEVALGAAGDMARLKTSPYPSGTSTVDDELGKLIGTIGENIILRRCAGLAVSPGVVASYVHNSTAPGLGKIGVLVALKGAGDRSRLADLGRQLAMHVAAANPRSVGVGDLDSATLDAERRILAEQAAASGKPQSVIDKMVEGRLRKFYEEVVLLEQTFVIDGERKVSKVLADATNEIGAPVQITGFLRYQLGEGVERRETDFAADVAAAGGSPG
jgi:elongation factor Ts